MKILPLREVSERIDEILKTLSIGGIVAIPTDTSYGLAVDATNIKALDRLFRLKNRERNKPVAVFLSQPEEVYFYGEVSSYLEKVIDFLPLEVTIITWAKKRLPEGYVVHKGKIGLRVANHFLPREIVKSYGKPITATSANRSGEPEIYDSSVLVKEFKAVDIVVDGGVLPKRPVSTIIDFTFEPPRVVREGFHKVDYLEKLFGFSLDKNLVE